MDNKTLRLLKFIAAAPCRSYVELQSFNGSPLDTSLEYQRLFADGAIFDATELFDPDDNITRLAITPRGREILEAYQQKRRQRLEDRLWKLLPLLLSSLALIVSTIALLESLHWIHISK